ncbi:MAG: glycosyl transferase, partial [Rhodanobacteraceae bacterium]
MPADARTPDTCAHLLGDCGYTVVMTASGSGCSRWKGLAVTRWRPGDRDGGQGSYVYLRDVTDGTVWSVTALPSGGTPRCWFDEGLARFARRDGAFTTTLEVAVDPGHAVEVRGIGVRNDGPVAREIELTSYVELVLGSAQADRSHPAYSKMFVQTACEDGVLLAWRRKKDPSEPDIWTAYALVVDGTETGGRECETDRARFIGRDRSLAAPLAMQAGQRLSDTVGTVLDPIFSLRARLAVGAGETRRVAFVTAVAASREEVLALIRRCLTPVACGGVYARAREAAPLALKALGIDAAAARRFQQLAGALVGSDDSWRTDAAVRAKGEGGAPVLWAKGISGDLPIVLLRIDASSQIGLVEEMLLAQHFWRARQLPADLVVVNAARGEGAAALDAALQGVTAQAGQGDKSQGSVFLLRDSDLDARLRDGLSAAACIVLDGRDGDLARQLARRSMAAGISFPELPVL